MDFDDGLFDLDDFLIDPEDVSGDNAETWDTGIESDIFASGSEPDIFTTKDL